MNTRLVTCMYSDLHGTEFGGRASRDHWYLCSLKNELNLHTPIHVFTSESHRNTLEKLNSELVNIISEELAALPVYKKIKDLKETNVLEPMRCYEIMYSKTHWLRKIIDTTEADYYYWIDAGLSHNGLFPPHLLREGDESYCEKYFNFSVFNERLIPSINDIAGDKLYCICFDQSIRPWQQPIDSKYVNSKPMKKIHTIGGMFGGKKDIVKWFCDEFDNRLKTILEDGKLFNEEQIYTAIISDNIDRAVPQYFNSWYYPGNELYNGWTSNIDNVIEFYKIFTHER